ncbi:MAG: PilN domain-containing protein [Polyangiales bacterium]
MIRVNLLPRRREAKRESGKAWIFVLAAAFMLEVVGIITVHFNKKSELDTQNTANAGLQAGIDEKRAKVANHEAIKKELADYVAREDAINKLLAGRTGPTAMLIEASRILTPRRMPTVDPDVLERLRRENPGMMPSEKWDPKRLWITAFKESNRELALQGVGKSNDDVAEFLRRMTVSKYFDGVRLVRTDERLEKDPLASGGPLVQMVSFDLRAKVRY